MIHKIISILNIENLDSLLEISNLVKSKNFNEFNKLTKSNKLESNQYYIANIDNSKFGLLTNGELYFFEQNKVTRHLASKYNIVSIINPGNGLETNGNVPEGMKKHNGISGSEIYLPEIITPVVYDENTENYKKGEVFQFSIGDKLFTAKFNDSGEFLGYYYLKGEQLYENPKIQVINYKGIAYDKKSDKYSEVEKESSIYNAKINARFNVSGVPAKGLEIIQIVEGTSFIQEAPSDIELYLDDNRFIIDSLRFEEDGEKFERYIDGAKISLDGSKKGGGVYDNLPYFIGEELDNPNGILPDNYVSTGFIQITDKPTAQLYRDKLRFTTLIIAINYMETGADLILGTIRWSFQLNGNEAISQNKGPVNIKGVKPKNTDIEAIQHYFPGYSLFNFPK